MKVNLRTIEVPKGKPLYVDYWNIELKDGERIVGTFQENNRPANYVLVIASEEVKI